MWSRFCEYINQANLRDVNFSLEMISNDKRKGDIERLTGINRDIVLKAYQILLVLKNFCHISAIAFYERWSNDGCAGKWH
jgi:hypothetical protein